MKFHLFIALLTCSMSIVQASGTPMHKSIEKPVERYDTCLLIKDRQDKHHFLTEVAITAQQKKTGMMFRTHMNDNNAMLFFFQKPQKLSFWMKNVQFPLDMLFFNQHGVLQEIKHNVPPCTSEHCPIYPAKHNDNIMVLELKGGTTYSRNISIGATLETLGKGDPNCRD